MLHYNPIVQTRTSARITFISDLHGKPGVLAKIIDERNLMQGLAERTDVLVVLGDSIDRGLYEKINGFQKQLGAELVIDRLCALKHSYPEQVFVIMGNHEMSHLSNIDARQLEAGDISKAQNTLRLTPERLVFLRSLPLGLILRKGRSSVLATHSGIPLTLKPKLHKLHCYQDVNHVLQQRWAKEITRAEPYWIKKNGYSFSSGKLLEFLKKNNLDGLIRGHGQRNMVNHLAGNRYCLCIHTTTGNSNEESAGQRIVYAAWDNSRIPGYMISSL